MPPILCPVCGGVLRREERRFLCPSGHSFDLARQGYLNLLTVEQKHSLHPGDTRDQVAARRAFLSGGFYRPIADRLCELAREFAPEAGELLDVGCGEGYYSVRAAAALGCGLTGVDIAKDAVRYAAGQYKNAAWLCATAAHLPFPAETFGLVLSLFALAVPGEFARVLRPGGVYIEAVAAPDHLLGLKEIIYPRVRIKEKDPAPRLPGFRLEAVRPLSFPFAVEGGQVQNLLAMTPHYWRISKEGAAALAATQRLEDRASVVFYVYRKDDSHGTGDRIEV